MVVGALVVVRTYRDYGPTFDEGVQAGYGELALRYFESGGRDKSYESPAPPLPSDLYLYGPLVEMVPALFYSGDGPAKYHTRHLFLGLLALGSLLAVWKFGRRFGDPRVALFALICVATLPRFYGHCFNNSKDVSFALSMLWFMAALAAMFTGASVRWSRAVWCGVAFGLGLCMRPGGFPLFAMFLLGAAVIWLATRERDAAQPGPVGAALGLVPKLLVVFAMAWAIMVVPWPWAHGNVLARPLAAMKAATEFHTTMPVLFEGVTAQSDALPWYYIPKYVLIVTPLGVLALALVGLAGGARDLLARRTRALRMLLLSAMWLFAPLALFAAVRPNVYGGMRHFLFVLPALGILAGCGAARILGAFEPRPRRFAWIVLLAIALWPLKDIVRLHPYQMTYYNALVGGVRGASGNYWTDYSLTSYAEAIEWVNARAAEHPERELTVVIAAGPAILIWAEGYAADNVELVSLRSLGPDRRVLAPADYYVGTSRGGLLDTFPESPAVHTIGREGVVFTVIKADRTQ
jgi:hypothetical protein